MPKIILPRIMGSREFSGLVGLNDNDVFVLDKKGESLRQVKIPRESVFILGDHEGLPRKELKRLKKITTPISIGPKIYFASQVVSIINNELDIRDI